jgi:hypothetical protein
VPYLNASALRLWKKKNILIISLMDEMMREIQRARLAHGSDGHTDLQNPTDIHFQFGLFPNFHFRPL